MAPLPETILQFGAGRFLRAFADYFVHEGNEAGQNVGRIVVVQSTGDARADALNRQQGQYHVIIRGYQDGQVIDRVEEIRSISRALHAGKDWNAVLEVARSPELQTILSNTTEAGFKLDPTDTPDLAPPNSFPAKLLQVLKARFDAGLPGLGIIPCELMEGNAGLLRGIVLDLAQSWNYPTEFQTWLTQSCRWLHTLVDRIVSGTPTEHPLLATDEMVIVAEPFAFFALESSPLDPFVNHPAIRRAADVQPFFLRKVRILNAAHTALLIKAVPRGFKLVREAIADPELETFLKQLLFQEIVPTLEGRVEDGEKFALQTLDRFRNPFLDHKFSDIALHHADKVKIRLMTTQAEYLAKFGKPAPLLTEVLSNWAVV
ncbi:mannitol dehydrogenase family protein [Tuwongella immobilis]|uniref:Tagaturonate reductase n=1 Tax=Tuwongella immobilis TaxID=692036 RepID=A0A6C2YPV5_9BACT|nr:altronate dehydrogenase [Tuwongella immobilis]VIP03668.1 tagaturonate reductase : Mannitol-1-phosphate/altronate dehydrogenases OS=Chthonomonas calidirosea (strain DSM 23976 / ICMP 18418 / T49) GN=CCALI_02602 PE=4 SV=1: Mannitol_dh: Mannitol_dh_C [Tuwongella immobilis]VTS04704.1 tagaturonate reductase : Mannitol-1-phosphate/altronate dehydrogenases OS=Chthonomonas calidirosea (strain DSM 23976 / ICMP 18418 / T49) GN=CCALI_02602 PE=4 SV=1: Mannitol_dh: Mannitol_dh_C [Tuwongella immobilis]